MELRVFSRYRRDRRYLRHALLAISPKRLSRNSARSTPDSAISIAVAQIANVGSLWRAGPRKRGQLRTPVQKCWRLCSVAAGRDPRSRSTAAVKARRNRGSSIRPMCFLRMVIRFGSSSAMIISQISSLVLRKKLVRMAATGARVRRFHRPWKTQPLGPSDRR